MRILMIDIENSPNLAHVWRLWKADVSINQIQEASEVMCFAYKWLNEDGTLDFSSAHHDGRKSMVLKAHCLLDEADAVLHYNGKQHDIPHLNREFLLMGLKPPSPYQQIDLLKVVRKVFAFPSNKLDYVSRALGLEGKARHEGHGLWVKCMQGDPDAWARMEEYNKQDVMLLEQLYNRIHPWIHGHPSYGAHMGTDVCPACGNYNLEKRGLAYTRQAAYQRYRCNECGKWSRSSKPLPEKTSIVEVA